MGLGLGLGLGLAAQRVSGPQITPVDTPRIFLLGPSTTIRNAYGRNDTPLSFGHSAVGPYSWALRYGMRFEHRLQPNASAIPWVQGDNLGSEGALLAQISAQCDAVVTLASGVAKKWVVLAPGRNDIQNGMNATTFMTNLQTCIDKLVAGGFTGANCKLIIEGIWKKPTAYGAPWQSGGPARVTTDSVNAQMKAKAATIPNCVFLDMQSYMKDPASADENPYAGTTISDSTHYAPPGAQRAGKAIQSMLGPYITPKSYPAPDANNKMPAMAGTTGTLANGATGTVYTGWEVAKEAAGNVATVVASLVTLGGKPYQRMLITPTAGANALTESAQLRLASNGSVAHGLAGGTLLAFRYRLIIAPTTALIGLAGRCTDLGTNGRQPIAIGTPYEPGASDNYTQAAGAPASSVMLYLDAANGLDLWMETPSMALIAGSQLRPMIAVRYGPTTQPIQADIGEVMTFIGT